MMIRRPAVAALGLLAALFATPLAARPQYRVDRAVLLIRHGVRAPLSGEAAAARFAPQPFAAWATPESRLTPHGAAALSALARYERGRLLQQGLLPRTGCPAEGQLAVWTNSVSRTIASGQALAEGLAPGCAVTIAHRPESEKDPLFDALEAGAVPFEATAAAASINAELDGGTRLMRGTGPAVQVMERVLGCDHAPKGCDFAAMPNTIAPSSDGRGLTLSGPIDLTSGTAQVFLLQYAEGFAPDRVGWGRASAADIATMSLLHARLFEVFARSHYMAPRVGGLIARQIASAFTSKNGPTVKLFVGHDNTIAAVTALLGTHFQLPGYGADDPPIGGGLLFERLTDRATGRHRVRLSYLAQTPEQVRQLSVLGTAGQGAPIHPLAMAQCPGACSLERFDSVIADATALLGPGDRR